MSSIKSGKVLIVAMLGMSYAGAEMSKEMHEQDGVLVPRGTTEAVRRALFFREMCL